MRLVFLERIGIPTLAVPASVCEGDRIALSVSTIDLDGIQAINEEIKDTSDLRAYGSLGLKEFIHSLTGRVPRQVSELYIWQTGDIAIMLHMPDDKNLRTKADFEEAARKNRITYVIVQDSWNSVDDDVAVALSEEPSTT